MSQPLSSDTASGGRDHTSAGIAAAKGAAVALWVLVGGALAYGVSQTVIRASALFSG